jgi:AraC-like DNA-binding protein
MSVVIPSWTGGKTEGLEDKKGNPRIDSFRSGDFFYSVVMNHANIKKALQFIDKNFHHPLSLEQVARESGMSKYHFARTFKAVTGMTFKTYHNKKRIEVAKELLKDNEMRITDVCYSLGFNDASYFNRVFRKYGGSSPSSYKKTAGCREQESEIQKSALEPVLNEVYKIL